MWTAQRESIASCFLGPDSLSRSLRPPAYLAMVAGDGGVRVHPVTPIVSSTGLYVFMERTSPKGRDLRDGRRFGMHNGVPDTEGSGGEQFDRPLR